MNDVGEHFFLSESEIISLFSTDIKSMLKATNSRTTRIKNSREKIIAS